MPQRHSEPHEVLVIRIGIFLAKTRNVFANEDVVGRRRALRQSLRLSLRFSLLLLKLLRLLLDQAVDLLLNGGDCSLLIGVPESDRLLHVGRSGLAWRFLAKPLHGVRHEEVVGRGLPSLLGSDNGSSSVSSLLRDLHAILHLFRELRWTVWFR